MAEIKLTNDGSTTIFVPKLNEHYHSIHGAVNESLHVFIKSGIEYLDKPKQKILEIGFGTGLNAFLSCLHAQSEGLKLIYHSIEKYPVNDVHIQELNFFNSTHEKELFENLHKAHWNKSFHMNNHFELLKIEGDVKSFSFEGEYDLIFFDAFAPEKQPKMWTEEVLTKMYNNLSLEGVLVTYCAKGVIRRRLQSIGFEVSRIPGPPGKREMLRAVKK